MHRQPAAELRDRRALTEQDDAAKCALTPRLLDFVGQVFLVVQDRILAMPLDRESPFLAPALAGRAALFWNDRINLPEQSHRAGCRGEDSATMAVHEHHQALTATLHRLHEQSARCHSNW
jgi:hypothetical protein